MKKQFLLVIISTIILIVLIVRCSENFIFGDNKIKNTSLIKGTVALIDDVPSNIFVWLQNSDATAFTDNNGYFELQVPPPSQQTGGGLNGIFKLYFYLANFRPDSAEIMLRNGEVVRDNADINSKGVLRKDIYLSKLMNITTSFFADSLRKNYQGRLRGTVTFQATSQTSVIIPHWMRFCDPWHCDSGCVWRDIVVSYVVQKEQPEIGDPIYIENPYFESINSQQQYSVGTKAPLTIEIFVDWPAIGINGEQVEHQPGECYRVYPYVLAYNPDLPDGLMEQLENASDHYDNNFLNYPIKINYGSLKFKVLDYADTD